MKTEFEVRILNIDINEMINKCMSIGADFSGVFFQNRYVYDFNPPINGKWIRLRNNGHKTTLAVKMIKDLKIDGTKEVEIIVSDFYETNILLNELGYIPRNYQENFRIEFCINGVTLDIDKWPSLNPYIEIEGFDEKSVYNMVELLGFSQDEVTTLDVDTLYRNVGIILENIQHLSFEQEEKETLLEFVRKEE